MVWAFQILSHSLQTHQCPGYFPTLLKQCTTKPTGPMFNRLPGWHSDFLSQHAMHIWTVLERLYQHGWFAKLEKCTFDQTIIEFLGFVLSSKGLTMDSRKIQAIWEWKAPWNVKELQRFLGFVNFYCRFTANFAQVVSLLMMLLQKNVHFYWSKEAQQATLPCHLW